MEGSNKPNLHAANRMLDLFRANFWYCTESIKKTLHVTLVRPKLEYAAVAWDPHHPRLEGVQRATACFCTNDYNWFSSITSMLNKLDLCTIEEGRKRSRLNFMYKIIHGLVNIKINDFLNFSNETRTRSSHRLKLPEPHSKKDVFIFFPKLLETGISSPRYASYFVP